MREKLVKVVKVVDAQFSKPRVKLRRIRQWDEKDTKHSKQHKRRESNDCELQVKCHNQINVHCMGINVMMAWKVNPEGQHEERKKPRRFNLYQNTMHPPKFLTE